MGHAKKERAQERPHHLARAVFGPILGFAEQSLRRVGSGCQLLDPFECPDRNNSLTGYAACERLGRERELIAAYLRQVCAIAHCRVGAGLKVHDDVGAIDLVCASICDESIEQSYPVDIGRIWSGNVAVLAEHRKHHVPASGE
jgi:hypothetical protein